MKTQQPFTIAEGFYVETADGTIAKKVTIDPTSCGVVWSGRVNPAQGADVSSATTITLGNDGNFFNITGTTTLVGIAIAGWTAGAVIYLKTTGSQTWTNNGSPGAGYGKLLLVGAANVSMTANDLMILVFNGTDWEQAAPTLVK